MKSKRNYIIILFIVLLGLTVGTWAAIQRYKKVNVTEKKIKWADTLFKKHVYNKQLLVTLEALCHKYDTLKTTYTIEGTINMIDKADTNDRMNNVAFIYSKKNNVFYYKMGNSEIINAYGLYVAVDHRTRCMMVSPQKEFADAAGSSKMLNSISEALRSEAYNLVGKKTGAQETLSLLNEHHITCKQYSISFDTVDMKISRIYSRLTNIYQPLRKDNEKIVDMKITRWDGNANVNDYTEGKSAVIKVGDKWKAADKYTGYKIIKM